MREEDEDDDPRRVEVWCAMADQYLDTETRHEIPRTARLCLEAGLDTAQAHDVWRFEVTPAVAFNVMQVAGEWAYWDQAWLVARIRRKRRSLLHRKPGLRELVYRLRGGGLDQVWRAIARAMGTLAAAPPAERAAIVAALGLLTRHAFDFAGPDPAALTSALRAQVRALYPEPWRTIMAPVMYGEDARAEERVRALLASLEG